MTFDEWLKENYQMAGGAPVIAKAAWDAAWEERFKHNQELRGMMSRECAPPVDDAERVAEEICEILRKGGSWYTLRPKIAEVIRAVTAVEQK